MKRVATAAIAIPVALLITIYSPNWLFAIIAGLLSALMLDEYFSLAAAAGRSHPGRWFLIPAACVTAAFALGGGPARFATNLNLPPVQLILALSVISLGVSTILAGDMTRVFDRMSIGLGGLVYCSVLFGFMLLLTRMSVLHLFTIIWAGDSAAYYGGRAFGKHKLAPGVSPNKTVEGAVAGLIGSVVIGTAFMAWQLGVTNNLLLFVVISGVCGVAGQIGDLVESALKRSAGVKDSSTILPGHGGILDRLDSLLFAAPVYFFLTYLA